MKNTNKELLIALLNIKKLYISELEKKLEKQKNDKQFRGIYSSIMSVTIKEIRILLSIINSEEKIG